jgi:hypothetical protein
MYTSLLFGYNRFGFDSTKEIQKKKRERLPSARGHILLLAFTYIHPYPHATRREANGSSWLGAGAAALRPPRSVRIELLLLYLAVGEASATSLLNKLWLQPRRCPMARRWL